MDVTFILIYILPYLENRDIIIGTFDIFSFNGTALVGISLPGGPYTGINSI